MEVKQMNIKATADKALVLVIGATGMQGGAVARDLLAHGHQVRVLTRNPDAHAAQLLAQSGAEVVQGNLGNAAALETVLRDATAVFSVLPAEAVLDDAEERYAYALVQAALKAGVRQVVHTSVAGIERTDRENVPASLLHYWNKKRAVEEAVSTAGFAAWTILRPAWIMENLAEPAARFMFPALKYGELITALKPETRVDMIAADNIAAFARAAFEHPALFTGKHIALAAESRTMGEVATILSSVLGKRVVSLALRPDQAIARGLHPNVVASQNYMNSVGFEVDIEGLKQYGVPLTTFEQWAYRYRDTIIVDA
jgi:uncharacterized protein YbjT (DUF2867 family)